MGFLALPSFLASPVARWALGTVAVLGVVWWLRWDAASDARAAAEAACESRIQAGIASEVARQRTAGEKALERAQERAAEAEQKITELRGKADALVRDLRAREGDSSCGVPGDILRELHDIR